MQDVQRLCKFVFASKSPVHLQNYEQFAESIVIYKLHGNPRSVEIMKFGMIRQVTGAHSLLFPAIKQTTSGAGVERCAWVSLPRYASIFVCVLTFVHCVNAYDVCTIHHLGVQILLTAIMVLCTLEAESQNTCSDVEP